MAGKGPSWRTTAGLTLRSGAPSSSKRSADSGSGGGDAPLVDLDPLGPDCSVRRISNIRPKPLGFHCPPSGRLPLDVGPPWDLDLSLPDWEPLVNEGPGWGSWKKSIISLYIARAFWELRMI